MACEKLPIVLENTDQEGYGSMSSGGNSAAAQAAVGMPYTLADGNQSDLGFYEGVEDDHSDMIEFATTIGMNELSVISILSHPLDMDVFKIKSVGLENEGKLIITLNRNLFGTRIGAEFANPISLANGPSFPIKVVFKDGSSVDQSASQKRQWRFFLLE